MLQYINGYSGGVAAFVAHADQRGERFRPGPPLRKKADNGETFQ